MKQGLRVVFVLAGLFVLAAAPTWSSCPFNSPFTQGGGGLRPPGGIFGAVESIGGFWWEVGRGDPALGSGNDAGILESPAPASDAPWIFRNIGADDLTGVIGDWVEAGVDGCLDGGPGSGAMAVLLVDEAGQFALMAVQGVTTPDNRHDFDTIVSGLGPNGNDVLMEPAELRPELVIVPGTLTDVDFVAEVLPAADSLNCYDDGSGLCQDPALVSVHATQLLQDDGAEALVPVPGCDAGGCTGVTLQRDVPYCWDDGAEIFAAPGLSFTGPLPPGCTLVVSNDKALNPIASKGRGAVQIVWQAATFNLDHFDVIATKRGVDMVLNMDPILPKSNDGTLQSYQFEVRNRRLKGAKQFRIRTHLTDGTFNETPVGR